jgi:hypothetical protein
MVEIQYTMLYDISEKVNIGMLAFCLAEMIF